MAVKVTKGQICNDTISKIRSTLYVESFIIVSQSAQNAQILHYAAVLYIPRQKQPLDTKCM